MDKKSKVLLLILVILGIGLLTVSMYAFIPETKAGMDYYLGPTGQNVLQGLQGFGQGVRTSQIWITYIDPNILWIGLGLGVLATIFIFNPLKDAFTGFWAGRHKVTVSPSTTIASAGTVGRSTTPAGATTRPTVTATPVVVEEQKQEEPTKQEEQKTT